MSGRRPLLLLAAAVLLGIAALLLVQSRRIVSAAPPPAAAAPRAPAASTDAPASANPAPPAEPPSRLVDALNAPAGTVRRDLEILNEVFVAWLSNFPREGNPVGENAEITAALTGRNRLDFAFVPPRHPAINAHGELCDRWGTPFRFHQRSGTQMEITSAGPDRKFGTADDAEFAPWPRP